MYKRALAAIGIAVAASSIAAVIPVSASTTDSKTLTIADVLLSDDKGKDANDPNLFDRNWRDYDIVTEAVLLFPDLVAAASNAGASLTVVAPNDQAFRILAQNVTKKSFRNEADVFAAIASLGTETVKAVLTYHIVGAKLGPAAVLSSDNVQVPTLGGGTFTVDVISKRAVFVQFVDGDPNARNAYLNKVNVGGGELANGYIHGVDRVLRPIDL